MGVTGLMGTGTVRENPDPREMARSSLEIALERGSDSPEVRAALVELRRTLVRRPLDGKTRIAYAALIASLGHSVDELRVAAFHARRAADLAPVTVPVVRGAVLVLLRTLQQEEGAELIRKMFRYDAAAAARLLAQCGPLLFPGQAEQAVDDSPDAWLAWSRQLRRDGRIEEADDWAGRGHRRWPDDVALLLHASGDAVRQEDWDRLRRLLPPGGELPLEARWAMLYVHRARLRLQLGDHAGAASDLTQALALNRRSYSVQLLAGEVYGRMGDVEQAREVWNRALFRLSAYSDSYRRGLLRRLARLEEQEANSGAALRLWRAILESDPEDREARQRIGVLTGSIPS
jgi:tetratricopeptide (TPR) repeat protein